jgi:hypothetical protein
LPSVAGPIAIEFPLPEGPVRGRKPGSAAIAVAVPETAVHEDDDSKLRQDKVRRTRQRTIVPTNAVTGFFQDPADGRFGLRIAAADSGHQLRTLVLGEDVRHGKTSGERSGPL